MSYLGSIEKAPIVIEIGNGYTKCGFSGECYPRRLVASIFTTYNGKEVRFPVLIVTKSLTHFLNSSRYPY